MTQETVTTFNGTREEWCTKAGNFIYSDIIRPESREESPAPWRVTIGWPKGVRGSKNSTVLATCHPRSHSSDLHNEIFISPTMGDSLDILAALTHELIHADDDCQSGHKGAFKRLALAVGLTGKMTATVTTPELAEALQWWIDENGTIPHAAMDDTKRKRQTTRMLKAECSACGFTARTSRKHIDNWEATGSICPCCSSTVDFV